MTVINNIDATKFSFNGITYFKNFTPLVLGGRVKIVNTYDSDIELIGLTEYDQINLDSVIYTNIADLQNALLPVLYTRNTLSSGGGSSTLVGLTDTEIVNVQEGDSLKYNATTQKWENGSGGSAGNSEQRTGNTLVFDNVIGAYYNLDAVNGSDITLSNTSSVFGGKAIIYSKSETEPNITAPNDIRQSGTYSTATDKTNVMIFEKLPDGKFFLNIFSYDSELTPPTDLTFLNPLMDIDASNATFDGSNNVLTIPDSTANGNDMTPVSNPKYVASGINGLPSIRLDGTNYLSRASAIGLTDVSKRVVIMVYKMEDRNSPNGTYQNILMSGVTSYTSAGSEFMQLNITNNTDLLNTNLSNNALDVSDLDSNTAQKHYLIYNKTTNDSIIKVNDSLEDTKTGTQNIPDKNIFIGSWNGNNCKMLVSRILVLDNDTILNTGNNRELLELYLKTTYGFYDVFNEGVPSDGTTEVIARLNTINAHNSKLVTLMIGTNDWSNSSATVRNTVPEYKANLTQIVTSLQNNGSRVILMQIPPAVQGAGSNDAICGMYGQPSGCDVNATSVPYRNALLEVVSEMSLDFIDTYTELTNAPNSLSFYYDPDGRHFSKEGSIFVADLIKDYITDNSISTPYEETLTCVGDSITFGLRYPIVFSFPSLLRAKL